MFRAAFRRLLAIDDPPERTALAFSIGDQRAFSPHHALHTPPATAIAFLFRYNTIEIYTGTFVNNPLLTLVPIIIASYTVGAFILGRPLRIPDEGLELLKNPRLFSGDYYQQLFVQSWSSVVWPFSVGAMALAVVCSLVAYPLTLRALRAYRSRKKPHISTE